jgi:hypothetical protein
MLIESTPFESTSFESTPTQFDSMHNENIQNKNTIRKISNINVDTPPAYNVEMITYIDTPPKYEEPKNIESTIKKNNIKNNSNRKGACCYSAESDDSRCCGACYWLCPSSADEEQNNCCPTTFCDYWKSGYIQTTDGTLIQEERCDECECDDCFWTTMCLPCKFPIFFPCFLGSVFNGCMNKICGSERNYLL